MRFKIFTDGACLDNPNGPGAWAYYCELNGEAFIGSGLERNTTNNRMELKAILEAMCWIVENDISETPLIYSDSLYAINCITGKWKRKKNLDLFEEIELFNQPFEIHWVRGHSGVVGNEIADALCAREILNQNKEYNGRSKRI